MTLWDDVAWSACRAGLIAVLVVLLAPRFVAMLQHATVGRRVLMWSLLLIPMLTPGLVVGYAYRRTDLSLVRFPLAAEALATALLAVRLLPIAVLVLRFAPPPPVSAEAMHLHKLTKRGRLGVVAQLRWSLSGPSRALWLAGAVVFLLGFQEFDMLSLLQARAWTDALYVPMRFEGLNPAAALRLTVLPLTIELLVLGGLVYLLIRQSTAEDSSGTAVMSRPGVAQRAVLWLIAVVGVMAVTVIPMSRISTEAWRALPTLTEHLYILRDLRASLLFAVPAAVLACLLARWITARRGRDGRLGAWRFVFAVPGLLGSLAVTTCLLALFQQPVLGSMSNTPLPLAIALVLIVLPAAVLLRLLLDARRPDAALHVAAMMRCGRTAAVRHAASRLRWQMRTAGHYWAGCLVFSIAYFDIAAAHVLHPVGFGPISLSPITALLYNQVHYDRMPTLSAMVWIAVLLPLLLIGLGAIVRRSIGWSFTMARA